MNHTFIYRSDFSFAEMLSKSDIDKGNDDGDDETDDNDDENYEDEDEDL